MCVVFFSVIVFRLEYNNLTEQLNQASPVYFIQCWDKGVITKAADILVLSRQDQSYVWQCAL